jgi:hypothetical protein
VNSEVDSQFVSSKDFAIPSPVVSRRYNITRILPPLPSSDVESGFGIQRPLLNDPDGRRKV